jgi:hypothetical protein
MRAPPQNGNLSKKALSNKEWHHLGCAVQNQKVAFVIFGS